MKSRLIAPVAFALACSTTACTKSFSCMDLQKGEWAIEFFDDPGEDGGCPYEGTAVLDGEEHELVCEVSDDQCVCKAGHEFGTYDVTVVNTETGKSQNSVILVDAAPEPICVERSRIGGSEVPDHAAGGAGGANN